MSESKKLSKRKIKEINEKHVEETRQEGIKKTLSLNEIILLRQRQIQTGITRYIHDRRVDMHPILEDITLPNIVKFLNTDEGFKVAEAILEQYKNLIFLLRISNIDGVDYEELYDESIAPSKIYRGKFTYYDKAEIRESYINGKLPQTLTQPLLKRLSKDELKFERFKYCVYCYIAQVICSSDEDEEGRFIPFDLKEHDFASYSYDGLTMAVLGEIEKKNYEDAMSFIKEICGKRTKAKKQKTSHAVPGNFSEDLLGDMEELGMKETIFDMQRKARNKIESDLKKVKNPGEYFKGKIEKSPIYETFIENYDKQGKAGEKEYKTPSVSSTIPSVRGFSLSKKYGKSSKKGGKIQKRKTRKNKNKK